MQDLSTLQTINFPLKKAAQASLSVYQSPNDVPFPIQRVFVVHAKEACVRGKHAHKACAQLLVCVQGSSDVCVDDGKDRQTYLLDTPEKGLLIPPTLWAEQTYQANSILMVFTDHPYDEDDYIRDYEIFLKWRKR